ncbi:hypothetical protein PROFUN_17110, partial [Planoprotostelium fungivorum]
VNNRGNQTFGGFLESRDRAFRPTGPETWSLQTDGAFRYRWLI